MGNFQELFKAAMAGGAASSLFDEESLVVPTSYQRKHQHEMTRAEWQSHYPVSPVMGHEMVVKNALRTGQIIPSHVLADYPHLLHGATPVPPVAPPKVRTVRIVHTKPIHSLSLFEGSPSNPEFERQHPRGEQEVVNPKTGKTIKPGQFAPKEEGDDDGSGRDTGAEPVRSNVSEESAGEPSEDVPGAKTKRNAGKRGSRTAGKGGGEDSGFDFGGDEPEPGAKRSGTVAAGADRGGSAGSEPQPVRDTVDPLHIEPDPDLVDDVDLDHQFSAPMKSGSDYRITDEDALGVGGDRTRYNNNIAAITLLKQIEAEGRMATPAEQSVLVKYTGWGWAGPVFDRDNEHWNESRHTKWKKEHDDLKVLLTPEEWEAASRSTTNAHYTAPGVIRSVWAAVRHLGFQRGKVLEPSAGVGHFFGLMPPDMFAQSPCTAVELDSLSGRITKQLYQSADVRVEGFQDASLPDRFYDLAISNVPFGNFPVKDSVFDKPGVRWITSAIHNYFFAKALTKVREGGLVAFVTSSYTMDGAKTRVREYLEANAEFLGAIRLPDDAFQKNAGTSVVTDIIFLRKRGTGNVAPSAETWRDVSGVELPNGETGAINEYFVRHPEMMMGTIAKDEMRPDRENGKVKVGLVSDGRNLEQSINAAIGNLPKDVFTASTARATQPAQALAEHGSRVGAFEEHDGQICQVEAGEIVQVGTDKDGNGIYEQRPNTLRLTGITGPKAKIIRGLCKVRDSANDLLAIQSDPNATDEQYETAFRRANALYFNFVREHGPIRSRANLQAFASDPDYGLICAMETTDTKGNPQKADFLQRRTVVPNKVVTSAGTAKEALVHSLNECNGLDWQRMSELTGQKPEALQADLAKDGVIFHDPQGDWTTAEDYLSGNVRYKAKIAEQAALVDPRYKQNAEALRAVIPADISPADIEVRLGASWVDPKHLGAFVDHLLDTHRSTAAYVPVTDTWTLSPASDGVYGANNMQKWGVPGASATQLIDDMLKMKQTEVYDGRGEDRVLNKDKTAAAAAKAEEIQEEFKRWLFSDTDRGIAVARKYNDTFNGTRNRIFDGSHLEMPGLSEAARAGLNEHVKHSVWRMLQSKNTLMDLCVGAGKTWVGIIGAMEMRRIGKANKPMIVVPGHLTEQWGAEIRKLYPNAKVLVARKEDFQDVNRQKFMAKVATGDWDAVVCAHTSFGRISCSPALEKAFYDKQMAEIDSVLAEIGDKNDPTHKELTKQRERLEVRLQKRMDRHAKNSDNFIPFEHMGVDHLIVDESHCFPYDTLVLTNWGLLPIGQIVCEKLPVLVLSVECKTGEQQWKCVVDWFDNPQTAPMVRVTHDGGSFECTANHKIWTEKHGYVAAADLNSSHVLRTYHQEVSNLSLGIHPEESWGGRTCADTLQSGMSQKWRSQDGDEKLSYLPEGIQRQVFGREEQCGCSVLQLSMRGKMAYGATEAHRANESSYCQGADSFSQGGNWSAAARLLRADEGEQSDEITGSTRKDAKRYVRQNFSRSRRKWENHAATGSRSGSPILAHGTRHCDSASVGTIPVTAISLQGGPGRSCQDAGNRNRWADTRYQEVEVPRQAQDGGAQRSRVVGVTFLEQEGGYRTGNSIGRDSRVYCLEVEDNHNFFAEGVLVSNCFKNLGFISKQGRVKGLNPNGSERAFDMYMKVHHVQQTNNGGGVTFLTGTPITNSIAEMYTLQRYLDPQSMEDAGISHFDAWARNFGMLSNTMEYTVSGDVRRTSRFNKFFNLPELATLYRKFSEVKTQHDIKLPVPDVERVNIVADPSPEQEAYVQYLSEYANEPYDPNDPAKMLKITNSGRKNSLDHRLINPTAPDFAGSKVNLAVGHIARIHEETKGNRSTQCVFLDLGVPKANDKEKVSNGDDSGEDESVETAEEERLRGSIYQDIRNKLHAKGISPEEVAFIHDAKTDAQKQKLFDDMNSGRLRILIGSSDKMGTGMNAQRKMIALHHIDCPWRPDILEQREGRIIRKGNENPKVQVYTYATGGGSKALSMDAFMWQTVQGKAKAISSIKSASGDQRSSDDVDDMVMTASQMKALASGNPLLFRAAEVEEQLRNITARYRAHDRQQWEIKRHIQRLPGKMEASAQRVATLEKQIAFRDKHASEKFSVEVEGRPFEKQEEAGQQILGLLRAVQSRTKADGSVIGHYAGFNLVAMRDPTEAGTPFIGMQAPGDQYQAVQFHIGGLDSGRGVFTRMQNAMKKLDSDKDREQSFIKGGTKDLETLKGELRDFPHQETMDTLKKEMLDIERQLAKEEDNDKTQASSDVVKSLLFQGGKFMQGTASADAAGPQVNSNLSKMNSSLYQGQGVTGKTTALARVGRASGGLEHVSSTHVGGNEFSHNFQTADSRPGAMQMASRLSATHDISPITRSSTLSPGGAQLRQHHFTATPKVGFEGGGTHTVTVSDKPGIGTKVYDAVASAPGRVAAAFRTGVASAMSGRTAKPKPVDSAGPTIHNVHSPSPKPASTVTPVAAVKPVRTPGSGLRGVIGRASASFRTAMTSPVKGLFKKPLEVNHEHAMDYHRVADSLDMKHYAASTTRASTNALGQPTDRAISNWYTHEQPGRAATQMQAHFADAGHHVGEMTRSRVYLGNGNHRHDYQFQVTHPETGHTHTIHVFSGLKARYNGKPERGAKAESAPKESRPPMDANEQKNIVHNIAKNSGATLSKHEVVQTRSGGDLHRHSFTHADPEAAARQLHQSMRKNGFAGAGPSNYRGKWGFNLAHEAGGPSHRIDFTQA